MPLSIFSNPFLLAAVAVVAIGVAVYEILSSQEENKRRYRGGRGSPPPSPKRKPPRSPSPSPKQKRARSPTPSFKPSGSPSSSKSKRMSDSTVGSYSNSSDNNVRKRNLDQSSQKEKSLSDGQSPLSSRPTSPPTDPPSPNHFSLPDTFGSPSKSNKTSTDSTVGSSLNSSGDDLKNFDLDQSSIKEKYLYDSKNSQSLTPKSPLPEVKSTSSFDSSTPFNQSNETSANSTEGLHSNSSVNNLGKLHFDQASEKDNFSNVLKNSTEFTPMTEELDETPFLLNSENTLDKMFDEKNYCKNLLDKLSNDTKNVHENNIFKQNICKEESDSSENNLIPENEEKLINETSNSLSVLNGNCSSSDKNTCEAKNDDRDVREDNFPISRDSSSQENKLEISESNLCKSCVEEHINTQAYPCNHSYLCVECAVKIFRIYKKCSLCHQDVVEFVRIAT